MKYWIVINNKQAGPFELEQLRGLPVLPNTPVWHEGLPQWIPAAQVPEIVALFRPAQTNAPESETTSKSTESEISDNADTQQDTATESDDTAIVEKKSNESTPTQHAFEQERQQQQQQNVDTECPASCLGWAIASTLLCCMLLGIVAIIYSAKVKSRYNSGDIKGAEKASETAQWLIILAITLGLVLSPFQVLLQLL